MLFQLSYEDPYIPVTGMSRELKIKKGGSPSSFLSYKRLKVKLRVFLAGHVVALVTYCATKLKATCPPMIGQFVDTMIVALTDKE